MELHNTLMGRKLIEADLPRAISALERIADALENSFKSKTEQTAKSFLINLQNDRDNIDMSDGEALDVVYEILLNKNHT
tara:strand:- start:87 stop:323 length:237 start_codon:yes stop_codon:yes gene_type:complete